MWRAHGFLDDDRFLGQADIAVTPAQWDAVFGASQARVSASVTDASAEGLRVSATIENIVLRAAADVPDTGKDDQGVYVGIIEKDRVKEYGSSADAGAAEDFAYKMFIKDGKVTRGIKVSAAKLDRSKEYVAVSWRAHGLLNDSRYLGQADLGVTPAQWDAVFGVEPQVKATVSAASAEGLQVSATVENIVLRAAADVPDTGKDDQGVYVGIIEKDRVNEYGSRADAGAAEGFAYKMFIKDGTASLDLKAPAAKLDRTKEYVAVSWRAHGLLNDSRYLGQADLAVTPAQWDAVFGASQARVSASVTDASAEGLRVSATIENIVLRAAADVPDTGKDDQGVYVGIIEKDRVKEYGSSADAGAAEDFAYKMFIKDGKVTRGIKVSAAKLDRSKEYVAVSWRAHGLLNDSRYLGQADLGVTPAQWDAVFGVEPQVKATVSAASAEGLQVSATVENIVLRAAADVPDTGKDDQGVYVGIIEKDRVNEYATDAAAGAAQDFAYKMFIKDGKVTRDISVPAEKLDRTKEYVAVSWLAHGMMIDSRYLGQANLAVTPAQWDAVFGQLPKVTASVTDASAEGLRVSATIENIVLRAAADVPDTGKDDQGVYVGIIEKDRVKEYSSSADAGAAEDFAYKMFIKDGKVTRELKVPAAKLDRSKEYVAVSWLAHGLLNDSRYLGQADLAVASAQWDAVFGGVVVKPGQGDLQWGIFRDFVNYIENIAGGKVQVLGAASRSGNTFVFPQIKGGDWNAQTQTGTVPYGGGVSFEAHEGQLQLSILDPQIKVTGAKSAVMTAKVNGRTLALVDIDLKKATKSVGKNGEVTWKNATTKLRAESVSEFLEYDAGKDMDPVTFTVGEAKDGGTTTPVPPTKPVVKPKPKPQPKPVGTSSSQQAGSLSWGISSGFKGYVTGRIAKGAISTSGVGSSGGAYMFPQADGGSWNAKAQTGSVQFSGVVTFTGHKGLLTETFANPVITITGPTSGTISAGGRSFGLNLGAASKTVGAGGEVTWSGVPVNGSISGGGNTGGGASGGGSFAVDPLSFTVGAPSSAQFGSTTQTEQKAARVAAATPPATTGIRVITPADELVPGGEIEFAAPGFEVDERDILVVLYSDPIVLDDKAGANSFGEVRWIGTLPEDLEPGEHTITLQGSTDAGAVIKVVEKTKKKAKPVIEQGTVEASAQPQQAAAAIADPTSGPVWMWWVGAGALIALAGAMGALVVNQRRNSANATVDTSSTR